MLENSGPGTFWVDMRHMRTSQDPSIVWQLVKVVLMVDADRAMAVLVVLRDIVAL